MTTDEDIGLLMDCKKYETKVEIAAIISKNPQDYYITIMNSSDRDTGFAINITPEMMLDLVKIGMEQAKARIKEKCIQVRDNLNEKIN